MNEKHSLNAPDNDSLKTISQLDAHSELSTLYPEARKGWDGKLMSETDRQAKRNQQLVEFTTSIRKRSVLIGLLIPTPILVTALSAAVLWEYIFPLNNLNEALNIVPTIIASAICLGVFYAVLKKMFDIFYEHTLRLGPFLMVMWALLGISAQALYITTIPLHGSQPLLTVTYVGGISLLWSIALSTLLLTIWTSPKLNSNAKVSYIVLIALLVVFATGALSLANIL